MIPPARAWELLEPLVEPLGTVTVPRREALGRVLAEPLAATADLPGVDVSAMDGYAMGGEVAAGDRRPVSGSVAAGEAPGIELAAGAACLIMTGGSVPAGADRVAPVEETDGGRIEVEFRQPVAAGAHIRRRGEIVRAGDPLLPAGTLLTPGALSLLASHGYGEATVFRPPTVALLATGDEVVAPTARPRPGQVRDSHTDFLLAAGASLGLRFESLGISPDSREILREMVRRGLERDVFLLTGGVSMGDFDFAEEIFHEFGCESLFDAVAIQPGKPLVAARHTGGLVFGLPGNPASVMVTFWLFVRPVLRALMGLRDGFWRGALHGTLAAELPGAKGRDRFLPAAVAFEGGRPLVTPLLPKGSHDVAAYGRGTALVKVPANAEPAPAGDPCEVLPLAHWPEESLVAGH